MSDLVIPPGFANLQWFWRAPGNPNPASTAMGVAIDGDGPTAPALFTTMGDAWSEIRSHLNSEIVLVGLKATINTGLPEPIVIENSVSLPGTSVQPPAAPQVCVLARKRTAFGGRHQRGRMYFPTPLLTDLVNTYQLQGDDWSENVNQFQQVLTDATGLAGCYLLHTSSGSDVPPTPLLAPGFGLQVEDYVATQRRRLRRTSALAA